MEALDSVALRHVQGASHLGDRYPLLSGISQPADLAHLEPSDLPALADEMRAFLVASVPQTGGHLGAGLGVVELTIALYTEFEFPNRDVLVWDVGHQCYPHKLLTGRAGRFGTLRQYGGLYGYPDPAESPYDTVKTGHGGTSISTASGFALAWRVDAEQRTAVAVIGDGALQEGSAYEALNHAGSFESLDLVVVLNDNGMAISPSVGALDTTLGHRRRGSAGHTPAPGIFADLGFAYIGPVDGHDIDALRQALRQARALRRPVVVHAITQKGRGYRDDQPERTCYHAVSAPSIAVAQEYPGQGGTSFTAAFAEHCIAMAERDPRFVVITAAMLEGTGLVAFQKRFPERCIDVGMAEQHAVGLAAGLALAGWHPLCAIYSTFLQRAYDQVFQEVALQRARVCFVLDRGGLVGSDGATHNGMFDIGYLRCLPNFALMAPRDTGELALMMDAAHTWDGPVAIRIPRGSGRRAELQLAHAPVGIGGAERLADGGDGCLLAYGPMAYAAMEVRRRVQARTGKVLSVVNARSVKPLDEFLICRELTHQPVVFTLEDHTVATGFGSAVAEMAVARWRHGVDASRLCLLGIPDRFVDHGERPEQLAEAGLDLDSLTRRVLARLSGVSQGSGVGDQELAAR